MSSKEFDLFIAMILTMLEKGQQDDVIALLKEARNKKDDNTQKQ